MTCGGDSQKDKKMKIDLLLDSVATWFIYHYDFRMGCDPPFLLTRGLKLPWENPKNHPSLTKIVLYCFHVVEYKEMTMLQSL